MRARHVKDTREPLLSIHREVSDIMDPVRIVRSWLKQYRDVDLPMITAEVADRLQLIRQRIRLSLRDEYGRRLRIYWISSDTNAAELRWVEDLHRLCEALGIGLHSRTPTGDEKGCVAKELAANGCLAVIAWTDSRALSDQLTERPTICRRLVLVAKATVVDHLAEGAAGKAMSAGAEVVYLPDENSGTARLPTAVVSRLADTLDAEVTRLLSRRAVTLG